MYALCAYTYIFLETISIEKFVKHIFSKITHVSYSIEMTSVSQYKNSHTCTLSIWNSKSYQANKLRMHIHTGMVCIPAFK